MESHPQNPEFRNNPENFHPWVSHVKAPAKCQCPQKYCHLKMSQVKVFRIIPELSKMAGGKVFTLIPVFRILRLTFNGK